MSKFMVGLGTVTIILCIIGGILGCVAEEQKIIPCDNHEFVITSECVNWTQRRYRTISKCIHCGYVFE